MYFYQLEIPGAIMMYSTKKGNALFNRRFKPIFQKQVHSHNITNIDENAPVTGDGLISSRKDVCLGLKVADCLPVFLFNEKKICAIHCGWRGIASGIADQAKRFMIDYQYVLGASIGPCCYEIKPDVEKIFADHDPGTIQKRNGRVFLDLKTAVIGVLGRDKLIADLPWCTKCRNDIFYSYRAGDKEHRNYAVICKT
ncbi:hypothetical protein A2Y85_01760 [candidate division WOR-3 bacterium RBG_13_43_14]|uniref:Purine nucleoside phosphorylase n=1 Tax=candidate division WOR-3 bacterium RBG_13_43_14 TaxID=1802590 RepID=A0A1F4UCK9_UNCW3|nr:MAG: hypothetical protein A2Y85_01760 [candidate division WOR-3 bacterium RBG_13_43_14]